MPKGSIAGAQVAQYDEDGYVLIRQMFDSAETDLLARAAREDRALDEHSFGRSDGEGGTVRLSLWNHPGDTIYGMVARCQSIVGSAVKLLGGEVYHYHSKMIMKDAKVGGAWAWHQDYGYWYQNGVLFPLLTSAYIAIDPSTRENGCLQVLKGSHKLGRIDHVLTGDQAGADLERVNEALNRLELVHLVMDPGDVLFFHCNLLHRSDRNRSDHPRWSMICCYNAARNNPYKDSHHPRYTPLADRSRLRGSRSRIEALCQYQRRRCLARSRQGCERHQPGREERRRISPQRHDSLQANDADPLTANCCLALESVRLTEGMTCRLVLGIGSGSCESPAHRPMLRLTSLPRTWVARFARRKAREETGRRRTPRRLRRVALNRL